MTMIDLDHSGRAEKDDEYYSASHISAEGYLVECRAESGQVTVWGGRILTETWERLEHELTNKPGIPVHSKHVVYVGLLTYAAAQALRYWFLATNPFLPILTRIVELRVHIDTQIRTARKLDERNNHEENSACAMREEE